MSCYFSVTPLSNVTPYPNSPMQTGSTSNIQYTSIPQGTLPTQSTQNANIQPQSSQYLSTSSNIPVVPAVGSTLGGTPIAPSMVDNPLFTPGFLKSQIGKKVKIEFLVGTGMMTDRIGTLIGVGSSYILLQLAETNQVLMGDIYSIKFVTFYP